MGNSGKLGLHEKENQMKLITRGHPPKKPTIEFLATLNSKIITNVLHFGDRLDVEELVKFIEAVASSAPSKSSARCFKIVANQKMLQALWPIFDEKAISRDSSLVVGHNRMITYEESEILSMIYPDWACGFVLNTWMQKQKFEERYHGRIIGFR